MKVQFLFSSVSVTKDFFNHYWVSRLLKAFNKLRPTIPRYENLGCEQGLCFLKFGFPNNKLFTKQLTLNTCMLIEFSSSDRAQTIHNMRVDKYVCNARGVEFTIFSTLKTFRLLRKPRVVIRPRWPESSLDVEKCVIDYMTQINTQMPSGPSNKPKTQIAFYFTQIRSPSSP